jgi:hypothetical protein
MNAAARMIYSTSRYKHISPLLSQLHWLKGWERIDFKLVVLVFKCFTAAAPAYLADDLSRSSILWTVDDFAWLPHPDWSSVEPGYQRMVIEHFRSPVHVSGIVFRITSLPHLQSTISKAVLRHFYSLALFPVFITLCKVHVQYYWHFGHYNRSVIIIIIMFRVLKVSASKMHQIVVLLARVVVHMIESMS